MYSQVLYHLGLKRQVQVVCVLHTVKTKDGKIKEKRNLFFSTDLKQSPQDILNIYQARFHIEFCFRDAKQFSGLLDCQSRQAQAIDFHWNMAFFALNLTRAEQLLHHVVTLKSLSLVWRMPSVVPITSSSLKRFFASCLSTSLSIISSIVCIHCLIWESRLLKLSRLLL